MQAWVDGETIQFRRDVLDEWTDTDEFTVQLCWGWETVAYRIKPKPRHFWISKQITTSSRATAEAHWGADNLIEVVEVLKDSK